MILTVSWMRQPSVHVEVTNAVKASPWLEPLTHTFRSSSLQYPDVFRAALFTSDTLSDLCFWNRQFGSSWLDILLHAALKIFTSFIQHRHNTDTRMEFTQRHEAGSSYRKHRRRRQTGRRERDTQTEGSAIFFFFFPLPHPFLSPHLVGLDSSLQVLDPFVSLCSWATRKALGSWCRSHLRL